MDLELSSELSWTAKEKYSELHLPVANGFSFSINSAPPSLPSMVPFYRCLVVVVVVVVVLRVVITKRQGQGPHIPSTKV